MEAYIPYTSVYIKAINLESMIGATHEDQKANPKTTISLCAPGVHLGPKCARQVHSAGFGNIKRGDGALGGVRGKSSNR